jgi:hypothetical protein
VEFKVRGELESEKLRKTENLSKQNPENQQNLLHNTTRRKKKKKPKAQFWEFTEKVISVWRPPAAATPVYKPPPQPLGPSGLCTHETHLWSSASRIPVHCSARNDAPRATKLGTAVALPLPMPPSPPTRTNKAQTKTKPKKRNETKRNETNVFFYFYFLIFFFGGFVY